jgi:hypothetical protein
MTKVEAITELMKANGGTASLKIIYDNIEKYYPTAKFSKDWEAGLRGVLYRDIGKSFKRIGLSLYGLMDYVEEIKPKKGDVRMHSYMEGICLELGNFKKYDTYTADPSALYRDNLYLRDIATINEFPHFSYDDIVQESKRIDVVWFNKDKFLFPQFIFEIVDSIGTLTGAFNRSLQLDNFRTKFYIVAPEEHHKKYEQTINLAPYYRCRERFTFVNYETMEKLYLHTSETKKIESTLIL